MSPSNHIQHRGRNTGHSRKPVSKKSLSDDDKINLVIQLRNKDNEILKIRVPSTTKLSEIKKFITQKYGEESDTLYLTQLKPKATKTKIKAKNVTESNIAPRDKIDLVFKTSIGTEKEVAKFSVPKGIKISTLKGALATKFGLSSDDFELVHVSQP